VFPDPDDKTHIWGFYTLSPGLIEKHGITNQHQKRVMPGLPIPMIRIGYLGRDDAISKDLKLGDVLIHDAALRVYLSEDVTGWGLYLDPENDGLAAWYGGQGFKSITPKIDPLKEDGTDAAKAAAATTERARPLPMYAPLKQLLPEIQGLP
jgi:hypothetical protein